MGGGPTRRQVLRATGGALIGSGLRPTAHTARAAAPAETWPQYGYDAANTNSAPNNTGPSENNVDEQWRFKTGGEVESSPAVVDGTVYVGSGDGNVYALSAEDGTEQWRFEAGLRMPLSPAVVDDTVYVGSWDIYALSAEDGTEQWRFETNDLVISSPAVVDDTVYVGSGDNNVYALATADGTEQWRFEAGDSVWSSPAVVGDTVYIGSNDSHVYALSAEDGTEQWRFKTDRNVESSPAVVDGTVYVGSSDNNVYALSAVTGTEKWHFEIGGTVRSSPAVVDDTVYVGSSNHVYALDATNGNKLWAFEVDDLIWGSSPAVVDGTVYVGSTGNHVYALSVEDGTEQWRFKTSDSVRTSPAVVDGIIYVGSRDDHLYALTGQTESPPSTPTPTPSLTLTETSVAGQGSSQQERQDLLPVVVGVLGLGGLGGAGAWWLARSGDDSDDGGLPDDGTSGGTGGTGPVTSSTPPAQERSPTSGSGSAATASSPDQPTPPADPRIPTEIPHAPRVSIEYEALTEEEPIGNGGNAEVTKATLPTLDGDVTLAIKRPCMAGTLHTETVERLLAEAETWAGLDDHDHIVGVVDYDSEPLPWIAMEYMDGGHLGDRAGELDSLHALWTALAITKGVRHAHRQGVAHLDLKPENVLFRTVKDAWDVPKVADWGLSKHLLNHSKSIEGLSPEYAAPEQLADEYGPADDITDVYQLGAVFYELFTGRPPFEGTPANVMQHELHESPAPPSEVAEVPEGVDEILLTAMATEKADRYESILYFRDALRELYDEWSVPEEKAVPVETGESPTDVESDQSEDSDPIESVSSAEPPPVDECLNSLQHGAVDGRLEAAQYLASHAETAPEAVEPVVDRLTDALTDEENPTVRKAVVEVLGRLDSASATTALQDARLDSAPAVSQRAMELLKDSEADGTDSDPADQTTDRDR